MEQLSCLPEVQKVLSAETAVVIHCRRVDELWAFIRLPGKSVVNWDILLEMEAKWVLMFLAAKVTALSLRLSACVLFLVLGVAVTSSAPCRIVTRWRQRGIVTRTSHCQTPGLHRQPCTDVMTLGARLHIAVRRRSDTLCSSRVSALDCSYITVVARSPGIAHCYSDWTAKSTLCHTQCNNHLYGTVLQYFQKEAAKHDTVAMVP